MACFHPLSLNYVFLPNLYKAIILVTDLVLLMVTVSDDFKPLSVDPTKPGKLRVADDEVNVQLPVVQVRE